MPSSRRPIGEYTSIAQWIDGQSSSTPFYGNDPSEIDYDHMGFVGIDHRVPVHEVGALKAQSLAAAWHRAREYVYEACEIVRAPDGPPLLDREETDMIVDQLGPPPPHCYPLYFLAVRDRQTNVETVVYVGKTSSNKNRFAGGHGAFTKLHHPDYEGMDKLAYLGTVMLIDTKGDYLPLEAVRPLERAEQMLRAIEAQLIYELDPPLNVQARQRNLSSLPIDIHIQNTVSTLLRDYFIFRAA